MTCDRCKDIHKAQSEGKTQRECGCSCHYNYTTGTTFTLTGNTMPSDTGDCGTITYTSTDSTGNTLVL